MVKQLTALALLAILTTSCFRVEDLPDKPKVEFRSYSLFDSTDMLGNHMKAGRLTFYFEDGDGDLGLDNPDGSSPDTTNLFFTLYRKNHGAFTKAPDDDILKPSAYRIPYLEPIGQNDILKGTIDITFLYYFYSDTDTILYSFIVEDRGGHFSNTDSTCAIVLGKNGKYY